MSEYKLHCFAESGNAYKAALMLNLCAADWEPVWVDFFNGAHKSAEYLKLNPIGEVPALETPDGVLNQSGVMLDYLADKLGKFGGEDAAERRDVMRWLFYDNHKFTSYLATLRFQRHFAKSEENALLEFLSSKALGGFATVEEHLQTRTFMVGEKPTIADISLCGYLFFLDEARIDIADYPAMAAWLERIKSLEGWVHPYELMPRSA